MYFYHRAKRRRAAQAKGYSKGWRRIHDCLVFLWADERQMTYTSKVDHFPVGKCIATPLLSTRPKFRSVALVLFKPTATIKILTLFFCFVSFHQDFFRYTSRYCASPTPSPFSLMYSSFLLGALCLYSFVRFTLQRVFPRVHDPL